MRFPSLRRISGFIFCANATARKQEAGTTYGEGDGQAEREEGGSDASKGEARRREETWRLLCRYVLGAGVPADWAGGGFRSCDRVRGESEEPQGILRRRGVGWSVEDDELGNH